MYCSNCGKEIKKESRFCPYCGRENQYAVEDELFERTGTSSEEYINTPWGYRPRPFPKMETEVSTKPEDQTLGVLAIVFSALGGFLGLALAIIGLVHYKQQPGKKKCITALIILGVWFVIGLIIGFYLAANGYYY